MVPEANKGTDNLNMEPLAKSQNTMVIAAMPLLIFMAKAKDILALPDIDNLKSYLIDQLNYFESQLKSLKYSNLNILAARYCLCTSLDEAVLSTKWGGESSWAEQSLLSSLHKETWGGERFYIILEKMSEDVTNNFDLLELLYFILSLGFEGKYYNNKAKYKEIRTNLFYLLSNNRAEVPKPLYSAPKNPNTHDRLKNRLPKLWITIGIISLLIFFSAWFFRGKAEELTVPLFKQTQDINLLLAKPIDIPAQAEIPQDDNLEI